MNLFYCSYPYGTASPAVFTGTFPRDKQWLSHTRRGRWGSERRETIDWRSRRGERKETQHVIRSHAQLNTQSLNSTVQKALKKREIAAWEDDTVLKWRWVFIGQKVRPGSDTREGRAGEGGRHVGGLSPEGNRSAQRCIQRRRKGKERLTHPKKNIFQDLDQGCSRVSSLLYLITYGG